MKDKSKVIGKFEINSIFLLVCAVFAGALGYLYQIILGNILSVEDYGQANVLITYISAISTITQPMALLASRNIAIYKAEQKEKELNNFLAVIFEMTAIICFILCVIIFGFEFLRKGKEGDFFYIFCFSLTLVTNIIYNILLYVAQGFKQFGRFGLVGLAYALIKVVTIILIKHMQGAYIVMAAMTVSDIICIILLACPDRHGSIIRRYKQQSIAEWIPEIVPFYGWTFLVQILLGLIINGGDIILIKHFFSDEMSGIYAVSSVLCKIAIIGTSPILSIMYTEAASCLGDKKVLKNLLKKCWLYCSVIAGVYFLILNIMGEWIINFLYGAKYEKSASLLLATSFAMMSAIWLNIFSQYCMALGKVKMLAVILLFIIIGSLISALIMRTVCQLLIVLGITICLGNACCCCRIVKDVKE